MTAQERAERIREEKRYVGQCRRDPALKRLAKATRRKVRLLGGARGRA